MHGLLFTTMTGLIEQHFGLDVHDAVIDDARLPSQGEYSEAGYYPHEEMLAILDKLSDRTALTINELCIQFGPSIFRALADAHPEFIDGHDIVSFLKSLESKIHRTVREIYPEADPPEIQCYSEHNDRLILHYKSKRPLAGLMLGLLSGVMEHFHHSRYKMSVFNPEDEVSNEMVVVLDKIR